jgi:hypothetical protein
MVIALTLRESIKAISKNTVALVLERADVAIAESR